MTHISLGQVIWSSVKPIIKIYLIIGVGFLLSKMNILTAEATRTISDIVLTILLPCLSFNKIVANIEDNDIKTVGIICLTSVIVFGTGLGFAYIIRKFMPVPRKWYGGILAGGMFPNISDLPIAYLQTMDQGFIFTPEEGEKGVANVIIFLAMFLICLFNCGGFRMIENDFHYNDEENAIHEDEYSNSDENISGSINQESSNSNSIEDEKIIANNEINNNSDNINDNDNNNIDDEKKIDNTDEGFPTSTSGSTENADQLSDSLESSDENNKREALSKPPQAYHSAEQIHYKNSNDLNMTRSNDSNISPNEEVSLPNTLLTTESLPASSIHTESSIDSDEYSTNYEAREEFARRTISQPVAYTSQTKENRENRNYHHKRYHEHNNATGYQSFRDEINHLDRVVSLRSIENRDLPPQTMQDIIHEYSNVDQYGKRRRPSVASDGTNHSNTSTIQRIKSSNLTKILTSDATVSKKDIEESGSSLPKWLQKFPLTSLIVFFMKNCLRPCSMAVILALIIAFIPWVKALFVTTNTTPHIRQAPDEQPALSFLMDFTSYVGAASVPFGLILLGATLGRLKIGKLYPGFWKSAVVLVFLRQCIMPIFGVLWCDRLVKAGWVTWEHDKMLLFVIAITWDLPTMTTLIYFTASYTPPDCEEPVQMECVSFFLMIQYPLMVISLPFLVSYFLKVQLKV
ncbi:protein Ecm3p [Monosporozyma unispora]|nr:Protein M3 [Kazachstania unispora]